MKFSSVQFSSVAQSCPTLCDPMNHSTVGLPVHQQLWSSLKLMSVESVMPSSHLILCHPFSSCPQSLPASESFPMSQLFATPWAVPCQASLSITDSRSLLKLMSVESVMPSNHLILCGPLLPPLIFPSIRVFSNESVFCIRWPKLEFQF